MFSSQKCWWKSCYGTSTMPAAPETKMRTMTLASTQTQSMLNHDADARHSLVGQDLPSYALLQRCESTSFTCCGFRGKQQIGDKGKTEMGHVVWKTSYYLWFPDVHTKEQGVGSFARAIGACITPCEKAWHWFPVVGNWPHIFMLQSMKCRIFTFAS